MTGSEYFYKGAQYQLDSKYGDNFTGYNLRAGDFGLNTDPRTAAIIQDASMKLNSGIKVIEVEGISPEIFDAIPKQHLQEMNRLSKLTGTETTLHGPLIEASGFSKEGWSEVDRENAERQLKAAITRAHELDPTGNIPVTFHSSAQLPEAEETVMQEVNGKRVSVAKSAYIVNPDTGRIHQLREMKRFFPKEEKTFNAEKELITINEQQWRDTLTNLAFNTERGIDYIETGGGFNAFKEAEKFDQLPAAEKEKISQFYRRKNAGEIFLRNGYRELKEIYNQAYRSAEEKNDIQSIKQIKKFADFTEQYQDEKGQIRDITNLKEILEQGVETMNHLKGIPQIFVPLGDFVIKKSAETFGKTAFEGWKQFGNTAPIVSIENPPAGGAISKAEDLKKLVEKSREEFVKAAVSNGVSKSEAEDAAKKVIGATWDVGHINMLRKYGYDSSDIIKQSETIAPFVKHVHLSDNFGMEHTELPMGMGNVPIKEIMEKLGKEGFEGKKIVEAASWWQHMKSSPVVPSMEAFGSPLYPMLAQPGWNQIAGTYGNYFQFPSAYMPEQHFSLYGGGFSTLPTELGGQVPGKQSRMTGTPME